MTLTTGHAIETGERLFRGAECWWYLGPRGVARLDDWHVDGDGELTPQARSKLIEAGLCDDRRISGYASTVQTSTACNLGCSHCFQNTAQDPSGGVRPPRIAKAVLSSETFVAWHRRAAEAGFHISSPSADLPRQTCTVGDGQYGAVVSADRTLSSCYADSAGPRVEFRDRVDAAVLDYLSATGRLKSTGTRRSGD